MNIGLFKAQPLLTECVLFVVKILLLIQIYEYRFVYHSADTCSLYIDIYNPYNYPIPQLMHPFSLYICPYIKSVLFASIPPLFQQQSKYLSLLFCHKTSSSCSPSLLSLKQQHLALHGKSRPQESPAQSIPEAFVAFHQWQAQRPPQLSPPKYLYEYFNKTNTSLNFFPCAYFFLSFFNYLSFSSSFHLANQNSASGAC